MSKGLRQDGNVADVNLGMVSLAGSPLKLAHGMNEWGTLNITHGTTYLVVRYCCEVAGGETDPAQ